MIDDELPPTEEELRAAEALARALESKGDAPPGSDAAFAQALRASRSLEPKLDASERARAIERASTRGTSAARWRGRRVLLAAAALLLAVSIPVGLAVIPTGGDPAATPIAYGGPTDSVFDAPFPDDQHASARLDRIASARVHDYFAAIDLEAGAR